MFPNIGSKVGRSRNKIGALSVFSQNAGTQALINAPSGYTGLILDVQVNGTSKFKVDKDGNFTGNTFYYTQATGAYYIYHDNSRYISTLAGGNISLSGALGIDGNGLGVYLIGTSTFLGFNGTNTSGTPDTRIYRDAISILAQRNSTAAQTARWYATWTDASNGAWAEVSAGVTANTVIFGSNGNGTGAAILSKLQFNVLGVNKLDYGVSTASQWTITGGLRLATGQLQASSTAVNSTTAGIFLAGPNYSGDTSYNTGFGFSGAGADIWQNGTLCAHFSTGIQISNNYNFSWGVTGAVSGISTALSLTAPGVVEVNNGTAGTIRSLKSIETMINMHSCFGCL